jgi:hypothetical protein
MPPLAQSRTTIAGDRKPAAFNRVDPRQPRAEDLAVVDAPAAGFQRHPVPVGAGDRHVLENRLADTAQMHQPRDMAAQPLVGAVEFQAAELDPPRPLGQHEMPTPAIDQTRRAGHAGNPSRRREGRCWKPHSCPAAA